MLAFLQVGLIGGDPWWHDYIGPVLAAGTAIVAAAIAAHTANRRQETQLRHDRDLKFREHTRAVIDRAVIAAEAALRTITTFESDLKNKDTAHDEHEACRIGDDTAGAKRAGEKVVRSIEEAINDLSSAQQKNELLESEAISLSLRLGYRDPLVQTFKRHNSVCGERLKYLTPFGSKGLKGADPKALKAHEDAQANAFAEVLDQGDEWFEKERDKGRPAPWWKFWGRRPDARWRRTA